MKTLLIKNFTRSKGLMLGLLLLLISGLVSLNIGKQFLQKNTQIIEETAHYQQENINRYVQNVDKEMGLLLYYLRFGLVNQTPNLAGLSIGQRDINPSIISVTIRNLEEQKYTTDLMNPMYQLLGNLDFSFVLLYFFPLIIIAFCFNLISEEKEEGTWSLLLTQAQNPQKVLLWKIGIRYFSILLVLILLFIIAKFYLSIAFDLAFIAFCLVAILYVTFWFCISWLVVSWQKSSSQNALILLITWVMLTIIIPASVNATVAAIYPVPEAFKTTLDSREAYHSKWDKAKEPTIEKFYQHYPQFRKYKHPQGHDYSWLWYYAAQQMADDESMVSSQQLKEKLQQREYLVQIIGWVVPSINTQLSFNQLSLTDIQNNLSFWKALENFHEQKRLYFYPKIFAEIPVKQENWKQFKLASFHDKVIIHWFSTILPMVLISLLCFWKAIKNLIF
ncbi:DUF3526 domain-containing protein [Cellulophaga sp. BC115SP]|uniref:DUF3526 domain-containing protein n=1 Tax=Cellulophaga sp. BC115SP TaxID=2683263 RepID=UPI001412D8C2|nr:DUF3526 domain-containing protein [Cellulophaga sp. BC115SP]NBB29720.1 DUF3526 domain-containing protein [Cellulophaga sp. BC115SP]